MYPVGAPGGAQHERSQDLSHLPVELVAEVVQLGAESKVLDGHLLQPKDALPIALGNELQIGLESLQEFRPGNARLLVSNPPLQFLVAVELQFPAIMKIEQFFIIELVEGAFVKLLAQVFPIDVELLVFFAVFEIIGGFRAADDSPFAVDKDSFAQIAGEGALGLSVSMPSS